MWHEHIHHPTCIFHLLLEPCRGISFVLYRIFSSGCLSGFGGFYWFPPRDTCKLCREVAARLPGGSWAKRGRRCLGKARSEVDGVYGFVVCVLGEPSVLVGFRLGPPLLPFYPFVGEGSPTKIDYRKKGTLMLTSLLEDLVEGRQGESQDTSPNGTLLEFACSLAQSKRIQKVNVLFLGPLGN